MKALIISHKSAIGFHEISKTEPKKII